MHGFIHSQPFNVRPFKDGFLLTRHAVGVEQGLERHIFGAAHGFNEVDQLRKTFGGLAAVDGVTFTAQPGEIFGLLGPNGAGKTTTIGCISGLLAPSGGRVRVMGHDIVEHGQAARRMLGVVPQEIALYDDLSAIENLQYWGGVQGMRNPLLDGVLRAAGLRLVSWTRRGFDTVTRDPAVVLARLTRNLRDGDILLLHDGHAARTPDGSAVILRVLPDLLAAARAAGLACVTLRTALHTASDTAEVRT